MKTKEGEGQKARVSEDQVVTAFDPRRWVNVGTRFREVGEVGSRTVGARHENGWDEHGRGLQG